MSGTVVRTHKFILTLFKEKSSRKCVAEVDSLLIAASIYKNIKTRLKVRGQSMQKERGSSRSLSLHEDIEREAREIEKEMKRHPELDDIQVTEEMDAALLKKIQAYEEELEEEREAVKKVEENLRKNHYLSASAEKAGHHADTANAGRHFRVPGDSVEFSAELMPEIPRDFVLGGRNTGKIRNTGRPAGDVVSGYAGHTQEMAAGYAAPMEETASGYTGHIQASAPGYIAPVEATVSGGYRNRGEKASDYTGGIGTAVPGYEENIRTAASGYRGSMERPMARYAKSSEKLAAGYNEGVEAVGTESAAEDTQAGRSAEPERTVQSGVEEPGEGKVLYRRKKKKYWLFSLAAVLVIVMGFGVTSVGSKSHWKVLWETVTGVPMNGIDTEDMDSTETEDIDEIAIYSEIREKLKIKPVRIIYKPDNMKLIDYEIQEEILKVQLLYKYKSEIIRYFLYMNDSDASIDQNEEDNKIDEYIVCVNEMKIKVEEFEVADNSNNRQIANFEYKDVHYQLKGVMERSEFKKILENLYFY